MFRSVVALTLVSALAPGCGTDDSSGPDADTEPRPASTDHCEYAPLPTTAGAGGQVEAGAVSVGLADVPMDLPVGSALGGNTSRASTISDQGNVDDREVELAGNFNPSIGVETIPMVKAIALTAGDETVVILRTDTVFSDDTITHEIAERLGSDHAGKVLWISSHTHTGPEQFSADLKLQVGGGELRASNRARLIERMLEAAETALASRQPARIGIAARTDFDPDDEVSYDRRDENDHLHGGDSRKDQYVAVIRLDAMDGTPLAVLPVFGNHTAILDDDVAVFSTDISGMYERLIEEHFADQEVMAVHVQGAGGNVLPSSDGHLAFADDEPRWDFARSEENARRAVPAFLELWERAGQNMKSEVAVEMVTRSIELGPDWETFTTRDGALSYQPFEPGRPADREIFDPGGRVISPIDEFNAAHGAGLCGNPEDDTFLGMQMPNVADLTPYHSCAMLPDVLLVFGALLDAEFGTAPICSSTRTTVSALRIGVWLFATAPGEPVVDWSDYVRSMSPVAPERTVIVGYAQGHVGYILTAADWLQGGYEPSINLWGPLEGEVIAEGLAEVMQLAVTDEREDVASGGADRVVAPEIDDAEVPPPDPAPMAGTVPESLPAEVYVRGGASPQSAQPAAAVPRVTGVARFAWVGEDPMSGTPRVALQREGADGFESVTRRSGRPVTDLDLLLLWTPLPLRREDDQPRTHYWTLEWQAVSWLGAPGLTELSDRPGVPLGRYRFHVEGTDYTLNSEPFEVVPGPMDVTAAIAGDVVEVGAGYRATRGWRMLALEGLSNRYLPTRSGPLRVEVHYESGEPYVAEAAVLDAPGTATVTPPTVSGITEVRVHDRFGNGGTAVPSTP